jgi:hypothetical protein
MESNELLKKVRLVINEAADDSDVSLLSVDTRQLDDCIMELLPSAVSFIQKNKGAAAGRVNTRTLDPDDVEVKSGESGGAVLLLPHDFVELVSLQLAGWQSPVHRLYAHDSREAAWQRNEYTRAGICRPVCVEAFTPAGERCAMLFPLPDGDSAKPLHFVYEAAFNAADGLDGYDDGMADAVVYECASLLYRMFERYDAANAMLSQALTACGLQTVKQQ